jgi:metallo-beta-lactamase family protein
MFLTCLGAARTVTGSKHLLDVDGTRILVDCGQFQGLKELRERNWAPWPVAPAKIAAVVLTHAHLDHSGLLPRLVSQGYRGRIFCTASTAALTKIVLADAAAIQEEDAERANRRGYTKHRPALPLFTTADAAKATRKLHPVRYGVPVPIAPGVTVEFLNAGHLLGSAFARLRVDATGRTILFGGDLGRFGRPVLPDPDAVSEADVLLVESTYGDRVHAADDEGTALARIVKDTIARRGKVIIPAFALGRVEELLYWINRLEKERAIPEVPVYVDSPMATEVLAEYRQRTHELDDELSDHPELSGRRARAEREVCAFCTAKLTVVRSIPESRAIQESAQPAIVISSSGMATGGRVLHHLARALPDARNTILFSGYQAPGTRGRALLEGAQVARIHGQEIPVRAHVATLDSLSAHADSNEILRWLGGFERPPALTCLVHGEPGPMDVLKGRIERELKWTVRTPAQGERVEL